MSNNLNNFIKFTIAIQNTGIARQGFGIPMIISHNANAHVGFHERIRYYNSYGDVTADGFAASSPEALAAAALFDQQPHPVQVAIGRAQSSVTQKYSLLATPVSNVVYAIQVDGEGVTSTLVSITSDGTATIQKIHNALLGQLNGVVGKNYTAAFSPLTFVAFPFTTNHAVSNTNLLATGHGMNTGDGPVELTNSGGALPTGLLAATDYWIIKVDANTFQLADSLAHALAGTALTFSADGTGTNDVNPDTTLSPVLPLVVTGNAPGNWFSLWVQNATLLDNKQTQADPGVGADLDAILQADTVGFYDVHSLYDSKGYQLGVAAWAEVNGREYIASTCDTEAITTTVGNGDTGDTLLGLGYSYTCFLYHPGPVQMFGAALAGRLLPLNVGSWTAAFKTLIGVTPVVLTPTQRANLIARRMGSYTTDIPGEPWTWDGKVESTVFGYLDIRVGVDFFSDDTVKSVAGWLKGSDKRAYTDEDIEDLKNVIRGAIKRSSSDANPIIDPGDPADPENPPPDVQFPTVAEVDPSVRALRKLPNGVISGRFQGAIQEVDFEAVLTF